MAIEKYTTCTEILEGKSPNVVSYYAASTAAEIRADLQENRSQLVNVCMNLTSDFNKSSVIRASNAFLARSTYIVGKRKYDRRGTVGTHNYENIYHADELAEVVSLLKGEGYLVLAVDNQDKYNPVSMWDADIPEKTAFVYGEEQRGLSDEDIALCDGMVFIQQKGSVRSLNVAQAAACLMSEYTRRHG